MTVDDKSCRRSRRLDSIQTILPVFVLGNRASRVLHLIERLLAATFRKTGTAPCGQVLETSTRPLTDCRESPDHSPGSRCKTPDEGQNGPQNGLDIECQHLPHILVRLSEESLLRTAIGLRLLSWW